MCCPPKPLTYKIRDALIKEPSKGYTIVGKSTDRPRMKMILARLQVIDPKINFIESKPGYHGRYIWTFYNRGCIQVFPK